MCCRRVVQQSPMLIGRAHGTTASNGKSTYLNVLRAMLGTGNVSSLDIATLGQRFQAGRIVGKLANLGDDIPDGFLRGEELSLFKKLVTGDAIYTDVKNSKGFEFRPNATLVFSMNAMPRLADTTDGVFRRLAFVPFRNHFEPGTDGYDPDITAKMTSEPNLQRLAVLGLMELPQLIRRGALTPIPDMVAEVEAVKTDNDIVKRWLLETLTDADDIAGRWAADVYSDFKKWCESAGERYGVTQMVFTKRVLATLATLEVKNTRDRALGKTGRRFIWANENLKIDT
jgi:putative DNA primase/helicase